MILSKRLLRRTDLTLIAAAVAIVIMSLVIIGSATHVNTPSEERYWFVQRQGISIVIDIALAAFLMNIAAIRQPFLRVQPYPAHIGYARRANGARRAALDRTRTDQHTAV